MAVVFSNQTTAFDGSGAPVTATGPIQLSYNGDPWDNSVLDVYVSTDTGATYAVSHRVRADGSVSINLANGAQWYVTLNNVGGSDSINCSWLAL
jgi:hypothetical protein